VHAILADFPDNGIALARSLRSRGVAVTILTNKTWVARTRWAECHLLDQPHLARERWLELLARLARRGPAAVLAGSDVATAFLVRERAQIPAELRSFESATSGHLELMNKGSLYELAARSRVRFPWTLRLSSPTDLDRIAGEASYPCLMKPALSHVWRGLFGEHRVIPLAGPEDLLREARPGLEAGLELLVTEHVPGPDTNLEGATTVRSTAGDYTVRYGRRKVRMYPPGYGAVAINECAEIPETMQMATTLLDAAGFAGISHLEAKRHDETGERILIEVNVRVPRGFGLGDACGADASWRLYGTLAGLELGPLPSQTPGVRNVVPPLELRAVITHLLQRKLSVPQILSGYRGVSAWNGLSWRDPLPVLLVLTDFAKWIGRYVKSRLRRK
jgi:predicted ATP-grasp superfamily ATP-dependent carboligase